MLDKPPHEIYPILNEKRETLKKFRDEAIKIGMVIIGLKGTPVVNIEENFVLIGIINRSIDLIGGFLIVLDDWNLICSAPIVRLQLDNLLRLNYFSGLENLDEISKKLFSGEQFGKINDTEGKPLTDARLREYAKKNSPGSKIFIKAHQSMFIFLIGTYSRP